jgi:hypothetical protein
VVEVVVRDWGVTVRKIASFLAGVAALAVVASLAVAAPAEAVEKRWVWRAGGDRVGVASYVDSGDVMRVNDMERDDRSVLIDVWKKGRRGGTHIRCWDHTGSETDGVYCSDMFDGSGWGRNAKLRGRLCKGEHDAGAPGGGRITKCQGRSKWKTFFR